MTTHFDHINAHRSGLHVPYLAASQAGSHSPAVELFVDEDGQLLVRHDYLAADDVMVCIRVQDRPAWVRADHLGHRACDACLDLWRIRSTEHRKVGDGLFTHTTLPASGDPVLLHADEQAADHEGAAEPLLRVREARVCGGSVRRRSTVTCRQEVLF